MIRAGRPRRDRTRPDGHPGVAIDGAGGRVWMMRPGGRVVVVRFVDGLAVLEEPASGYRIIG